MSNVTGSAPPAEDYHANSGRACAWPRRLSQGPVRKTTLEEFRSWIVYEDARLLVVSKSGDMVCHPSKDGPWSSLVGAAREYTQLPTVHLVFRLDRETSGIVVLAKDAKMASRLQTAMMTKPVVCSVLQEARGKSGEDLAAVVENDGASLAASNYELPTIIPGDPPIACYRARVDPSKLRRGAR